MGIPLGPATLPAYGIPSTDLRQQAIFEQNAASQQLAALRHKEGRDRQPLASRPAAVGLGADTEAAIAGWLGGGGGGGRGPPSGFGGSRGIPLPWVLGGRALAGAGGCSAAFGSLAGLAGFWAEHIVTSGIGIGGSLLGGLAGPGLAASGVLGTAAVGIGTDRRASVRPVVTSTNTVKAMDALQTAIQTYGRNSTQAADATGSSPQNTQLGSFSPVARAAVTAASQTAVGFHAAFNASTGQAEAIGANIINQAIKTGEAFLPTLGKYATQNLGIIQQGLQPFFDWLKNARPSGGLGVFTQLENLFQSQFPLVSTPWNRGWSCS